MFNSFSVIFCVVVGEVCGVVKLLGGGQCVWGLIGGAVSAVCGCQVSW